jgi:hypothetical protein
MANPRIDVEISSNIDQLKRGFSESEATVTAFANRIAQLTKKFDESNGTITLLKNRLGQLKENLEKATDIRSIAKYNIRIQETESELKRLGNIGLQAGNNLNKIGGSALSAAPKFEKLGGSITNANGVAIEFSRIIQDSPFGLIGIGNNIQQLTSNFAQVSKTAGGAGAAIKASLGALISPANLLVLGISAVTAAFTAYQMGAFDGLFATKDFAKSAEEAAQKLENYRISLNAVTRATIEGTASGKEEARTFENLRLQAENANIPLKDRVEAVKELQSKYPEYLGNLTDEQIKTGNVGDAYFNLTKQIIATAKARAFSDEIAKNSIDLLTKEQQEQDRVSSILIERDKLEGIQASKKFATGQDLLALRNQEAIQQKRINDLVFEQTASANDRGKIEQENLDLQIKITGALTDGAKFTKTLNEEIDEQAESLGLISSLTSQISKLNDARTLTKDQEEINLIDVKVKKLQEQLDLINAIAFKAANPIAPPIPALPPRNNPFQGVDNAVSNAPKSIFPTANEDLKSMELLKEALNGTSVSVGQFFAAVKNGAAEGFGSLEEFVSELAKTQDFINDVFATLEAGIENTIGNIAFSIGDALASGASVLEAGGAALLGGLASILNQLGQLAISTGLAIGGIKAALTTLNPAVAIAAGVALVALAGFVGAKARSLGGGGGGGGFSGGGGVGSSSGASSQSFGGTGISDFVADRSLSGELVVRGQDLVYVFGQASNKMAKG